MVNLEFCDIHNMVAYLKKIEGSEGFHQIVDFLNASHIRYLQLTDSDDISSLSTTKIFEQLSLMSNMKRVSKSYTEENIPLFPIMIIQDPFVLGEGLTHPFESHHTPTSAPSTSQPLVSPTYRRTTRQESVVPQPRSPTQSLIADKAASIGVDVRYGGATTTVTSLEVGHASELMVFYTTLLKKVDSLEIDLKQTTQIYSAAYTKIIKRVKKLEKTAKFSQARRRARIVVFDDEYDLEDPSKHRRKITEIDQDPGILLVQHDVKIQGRYGHDMKFDYVIDTAEKDVSTVELVSTGGIVVTTDNVTVSTLSPTRNTRVSTADDITMAETLVYIRKSAAKDKGKGKMAKSETVQTKTRLQQEQERLSFEAAVRLQAELDEEKRQRIEWQLRGYSFDEIRPLFETTMRRVNTFILIESEVDRADPELAAESSKRDAEEELDQEIPVQGMNVEALQTKYPIIDWEIYTKGTRKYWKIIRVGNHTEVHHFFNDMLKAFDRDDLRCYGFWLKRSSIQQQITKKERYGWSASCVYREGNRHLHAGREGVSIVKGNSYIDAGCKALGASR
nr:hypothetical protein [Tanacetum cinerariifolium]